MVEDVEPSTGFPEGATRFLNLKNIPDLPVMMRRLNNRKCPASLIGYPV